MTLPTETLLQQALDACRPAPGEGEVATYIPELAKGDPRHLGVALATPDGAVASAGDGAVPFTLQSVSKVISLAGALELLGEERVFDAVGMDPTADPFNSIMRLEMVKPHRPQNPLINAGALVVLSLLPHRDPEERFAFVRDWARRLSGNDALDYHEATYLSEKSTSDRNRALAYFMRSVGTFRGDVENVLDSYFRQCSLRGTARDMAVMGMTLASGGINPLSGQRVLSERHALMTRALMATCGLYDGSGEFAVRVGIPAKSGVGGGILASVPKKMGLGTFGPALDPKGNSLGGVRLLERLTPLLDLRIL